MIPVFIIVMIIVIIKLAEYEPILALFATVLAFLGLGKMMKDSKTDWIDGFSAAGVMCMIIVGVVALLQVFYSILFS